MENENALPYVTVAVVAIHGVADQLPHDTAHTIADMLSRSAECQEDIRRRNPMDANPPAPAMDDSRNLEEEFTEGFRIDEINTGHYQAFQESTIRIPVTRVLPVAELKAPAAEPTKKTKGRALEQVSRTAKALITGGEDLDHEAADIGYDYMREQLQEHVVSEQDSIFETIRLDSIRTGSLARVAVFEMYWADLSRFVGSWIRWIIEFYQLLFFLCLLGRKSLEFARAKYEYGAKKRGMKFWRAWPAFGWCQIIAEQALVLFVPMFNLYLLAIASCFLPLLAPREWIPWVTTGFWTAVGAIATTAIVYCARLKIMPGRHWPGWFSAPAAVFGAVLGFFLSQILPENHSYLSLVSVYGVFALGGIYWLAAAFEKSRSGALFVNKLAAVITVSLFVFEMCSVPGDSPAWVLSAIIRLAEWTVVGLEISWLFVLIGALGATIFGFLVPHAVPAPKNGTPTNQAQDKARRAAWTANLTLVLPALTVIILNLTLWQAILSLTVPSAHVSPAKEPQKESLLSWDYVKKSELWNTTHQPIPSWVFRQRSIKADDEAWRVAGELMEESYTPFYWVLCSGFSIAALLMVWSILPSVIAELGLEKESVPHSGTSGWLGESLSAGFRAMRVSGELIRITFLTVFPIAIVFAAASMPSWVSTANHACLAVGAWIVVALVGAQGPFKGIALGLRGALDVALDVINWLRLQPLKANPRARISARFTSLLRYIEEWSDPCNGDQFRAILIVTHSQGSIIAADLLRFLQNPANEALRPKLPIYLFTMGNPLRQLYSLRFPHLYEWARHYDPTWAGDLPLPKDLGLKLWVNAYRSGDYVGRYLWHADGGSYPDPSWSIQSHQNKTFHKREFCIGAGAHTHYWDETAPHIAVELDRLVGLAERDIRISTPGPWRNVQHRV